MGRRAALAAAVRVQLAHRNQLQHRQVETVVQALCIVGHTMEAAAVAVKAAHTSARRLMVARAESEGEVVGRVIRTVRLANRVRRTRVVEAEHRLELPAARRPTNLDALEEQASALFRILSRNHILLT